MLCCLSKEGEIMRGSPGIHVVTTNQQYLHVHVPVLFACVDHYVAIKLSIYLHQSIDVPIFQVDW